MDALIKKSSRCYNIDDEIWKFGPNGIKAKWIKKGKQLRFEEIPELTFFVGVIIIATERTSRDSYWNGDGERVSNSQVVGSEHGRDEIIIMGDTQVTASHPYNTMFGFFEAKALNLIK